MVRSKNPAKRSIDFPSSSSNPQTQRRRFDDIKAPPASLVDLPPHFFPSTEHRLRFNELFANRPVHYEKDVNSHLLQEVGFWNLHLTLNGIVVMNSLPSDVCELAVRLFFSNLTDHFANRRYHIGFKYKRTQNRNDVYYSNVFGQHIELSRDRLADLLSVTPGGLEYDSSEYNMRDLCTNLFGLNHDFSQGDWLQKADNLGVNALSPLAWVLHVWVINNYSPRQARSRMTAEEIWILGCLMGNLKINYPLWLFDLFRKAASHRTFTLPLGRFITHLLTGFGIVFPPSSLTIKTMEEFSDANLKKAGFKRILYPTGEAEWVRKNAPPPHASDDEATEDALQPHEVEPMITNVPGSSASSSSTSLDQVMAQLTLMRQEQASHNYYTRGMIHQLSRDIYGLYQHQGLPYPPPYDFPPPGFYPPAPPPEFPYPPPPPPPPSDD